MTKFRLEDIQSDESNGVTDDDRSKIIVINHTKDRKFWDSNPYLHQVRSYDFKSYEIYKSMSNSKFDKLLLTYFDRHHLLRLIRHFVCPPDEI